MISFATMVLLSALSAALVDREIDFDTEIVPLLSKAGCNAAACHGGAAGQAGFRLSLFGGDPEFDHRTIVNELEGRRVNLVNPRESLFIAKPTGQLDHGGGEVLDLDGEAVRTLEAWVAKGARRLQMRKLTELRVTPAEIVGDGVPLVHPIRVEARFDDGTTRDVTDIAVYTTQNESALSVSANGRVHVTRPGRQSAVVRFGGQVQTVLVTTPLGSTEIPRTEYPISNWIDEEIADVLKTLRLAAAPATDDASFLRRVTLDLAGRLPTMSQVNDFLADVTAEKRSTRIHELLASAEFTEYWTHQVAGLLRIRVPATDEVAAQAFYDWVREGVQEDAGWDELATELLLSEGDTHVNGAATFHRLFATAREQAEYVSEVFLGVRLRCANCHNHPLDQWTQDDYHGLAQIFAGVQRGQVITISDMGEVTHPRTGRVAVARIPGVEFIAGEENKRAALATWMTQRDNALFAHAMAGRIWEALMGHGLVTPVDDLRATNPATHPQLLERLGDYFAEHGYRIRPLIRLICSSAAYGRCSEPLAGQPLDSQFYSHAIEKPLSAEVLADAISDVTGVGSAYESEASRRAVAVVDRSKATAELQFLGQCLPDEACSAGISGGRGIASKLHLINGALLNRKITDPSGRLPQLLSAASTDQIVTEFFLRALGRQASEKELVLWRERIDGGDGSAERARRCEDFLWALLNCHEFTTNH